jgi:hypothetical protein
MNERLAVSLDLADPVQIDWAVIILFYSAVHQVEAYFATTGKHSKNHKHRDSGIEGDRNVRPIFKDYGFMKAYSVNARYLMPIFTSTTVDNVKKRLDNIKAHVAPLL